MRGAGSPASSSRSSGRASGSTSYRLARWARIQLKVHRQLVQSIPLDDADIECLIQGLRLVSPCTPRIDRLIDLLEKIGGGPRVAGRGWPHPTMYTWACLDSVVRGETPSHEQRKNMPLGIIARSALSWCSRSGSPYHSAGTCSAGSFGNMPLTMPGASSPSGSSSSSRDLGSRWTSTLEHCGSARRRRPILHQISRKIWPTTQ
jgi:hypothetical protein